jgi:hypothetical protein
MPAHPGRLQRAERRPNVHFTQAQPCALRQASASRAGVNPKSVKEVQLQTDHEDDGQPRPIIDRKKEAKYERTPGYKY